MRKKLQKALDKFKENNIDPDLLKVNINMELTASGWLRLNEPDDYINEYNIEIELYNDLETQEKEKNS